MSLSAQFEELATVELAQSSELHQVATHVHVLHVFMKNCVFPQVITMHVDIATDNWPHFVDGIRKLPIGREKHETSEFNVTACHVRNFNFSRCLVINDSVIYYYFPLNDQPPSSSYEQAAHSSQQILKHEKKWKK